MSLTYKELHETFDSLAKIDNAVSGMANEFAALTKSFDTKIVYVGCGSSYSLAKSMARLTRMHLNRASYAVAAGDLLVHAQDYVSSVQGAVIVCVSRSGSTSELMLAFNALKKAGCSFKLVSVVCTLNSELAKMSDCKLEMPWAFDESVCQTRCVTCMYFAVAKLIAQVSGDKALALSLEKTLKLGPAFLEAAEPIAQNIAQGSWTHAVVLADAQISGISEEGSLAYKEICQLPSNFYNILDSRHGPMVLFNASTLVVIAVSTPVSEYELKFVEDIKKKGCEIVLYSDLPVKLEGVRNIVFGDTLSHAARGIPFILINQLISYYKSESTGANPDQPSGLDAWIKL